MFSLGGAANVLVTGAASGIGRAVALQLAGSGGSLALLDRDGEGATVVAKEAIAAGASRAEVLAADVTDAAVVTAASGT